MNIGIYTGNLIPGSGGAWTYQQSIIYGLEKVNTTHNIYIFYENDNNINLSNNKKINYINIKKKLEDNIIIENNRTKNKKRNIFIRILSKIIIKIIDYQYRSIIERIEFLEQINKKLNEKIEIIEQEYNPEIDRINDYLIKYNIDIVWLTLPVYKKIIIPYIFTVWDLAHREHPYFPEVSISGLSWEAREKMYRYMLPRASYIITGNDIGKEEIYFYYRVKKEKIVSIPFSIIKREYNNYSNISIDIKKEDNYLFYPAQFWPHKNHIALLYAVKILKEKYNLSFKVVFCGTDYGNKEFVIEKTKELNLTENVIFSGFVSEEELDYLYKNAFALVFLSFFGPNNLPPVEALSYGIPVIVSDIDGHREQLKDAVIYANPKDENDIANKIKLIYDDENIRNRLKENGYNLIKDLTPENYISKFFKIIEDFESIRRCWSNKEIYKHK